MKVNSMMYFSWLKKNALMKEVIIAVEKRNYRGHITKVCWNKPSGFYYIYLQDAKDSKKIHELDSRKITFIFFN